MFVESGMKYFLLVTCLLGFVFAFSTARGDESEVIYFRILGGPPNSNAFSLAATLANVISNPPGTRDCGQGDPCGVPGLIAIVQNQQNSAIALQALIKKQADSAIATADQFLQINKHYLEGNELRVLAELDHLLVHFITLKHSPLKKLDQFKAKKIAIGMANSDNALMAANLLQALGINPKAKNIILQSIGKSFNDLRMKKIDLLIMIDRRNNAFLNEMFQQDDLTLIDLDPSSTKKLTNMETGTANRLIAQPANLYPNQPAFSTIEIPLFWVVRQDLKKDFALQLTKALYSNIKSFPSSRNKVDPKFLHEGAKMFEAENP